jgi:hypothetical protein
VLQNTNFNPSWIMRGKAYEPVTCPKALLVGLVFGGAQAEA